ncbi:MAG: Sensor protein CitS [Pelotomaculum sp. PtaB.Bin013]|nr:MAG: Sensor protein CitS [Pelotomaculum sp. PtaB.Bin013]
MEKEYEARRAVENLKQIEQLIDSSRKQRHDFHHQLQTVYGLLESGLYERSRDYISKLFCTISKTGELIRTDNLSISALLNTKIGLAEAKNIDLEITIECSLKEMPLTPLETSSLLGNLIDNALEAVEEYTGEHRQVEVKITLEHGAFVITCTNTGTPIAPEMRDDIFKSDFTTKEGHSGLGLVVIWAPGEVPFKKITKISDRILFKLLSLASLALWMGVSVYFINCNNFSITIAGLIAVLTQTFSFSPPGYQVIHKLDSILAGLFKGKEVLPDAADS